jgi:two-component system, OmpR family, sensor kinase
VSSSGGVGRARQRLRGLPDRTPLWVKLITAVLTLVLIALVVISIAGASVLKGYLLGQADNSLQGLIQAESFHNQLDNPRYLPDEAGIWVPKGGQPQNLVIPVNSSGYGLGSQQIIPGPDIPANASSLPSSATSAITVPATSGGGQWRIVGIPGSVGNLSASPTHGTVVLGVNVSGDYAAINKLTGIDLIVGAIVIVGLAVVGVAVVRASLRPLTDIEVTAETIAAGDLTRRVPDRDPRTEVGRLGRSLNAMLSQIEAAFDARAKSEFAARRSEERMRQFVADASHELRTPLTAIRGYAEYYRQRGGLDEISGGPARPALGIGTDSAAGPWTVDSGREANGPLGRADVDRIMQRVEQESLRMGVLVEDMLLLARLDQQRPLERSTVDMLTLAGDAVNDARVIAPGRSINLTVGSGTALLVIGDEVRLRQVIGNLMSNALNHTPEGTPIEARIRLGDLDEWRVAAAKAGRAEIAAAGRSARSAPAVIFEVADRGPGLTPEQASHVFERFYRGDQARTRKAGGTGLGLSIVAALVGAHGGSVWVESPPGGGATFHIAIPLAPEARYSGPEPDDSTDPGGTALPPALGRFPPPGAGPGSEREALPEPGTLARGWRTSGQPRRGEAPPGGPFPPAPPPPPPAMGA